jgi:hypothetical protein
VEKEDGKNLENQEKKEKSITFVSIVKFPQV